MILKAFVIMNCLSAVIRAFELKVFQSQSELDADALSEGPTYDIFRAGIDHGMYPSNETLLKIKRMKRGRDFRELWDDKIRGLEEQISERIKRREIAKQLDEICELESEKIDPWCFDYVSDNKAKDIIETAIKKGLYNQLKKALHSTRHAVSARKSWFLAKSYDTPWYDEDLWTYSWLQSSENLDYEQALAANNRRFLDALQSKSLPHFAMAYKKSFHFKSFKWEQHKHLITTSDSHESLRFLIDNKIVHLKELQLKFTDNCPRCFSILQDFGLFRVRDETVDDLLDRFITSGSPKIIAELIKQCQELNIKVPKTTNEQLEGIIERDNLDVLRTLHINGLRIIQESDLELAYSTYSIKCLDYMMGVTGKAPNRESGDHDKVDHAIVMGPSCIDATIFFWNKLGWKPSKEIVKCYMQNLSPKAFSLSLEWYPEMKVSIRNLPNRGISKDQLEKLEILALKRPKYFLKKYSKWTKFLTLKAMRLIFDLNKDIKASPNFAAENGRADVVEFIFETARILPCQNSLIMAARHGHIEVIRFVYEKSNGELFPDRSWMSIFKNSQRKLNLDENVPKMNEEVLEFMYEREGQTPLSVEMFDACENDYFLAIDYVSDNCAIYPDESGLNQAATMGHTSIVRLCYDTPAKMLPSFEAISAAVRNGHFKTVSYVLEEDPSRLPDMAASNCACLRDDFRMVLLLWEAMGLIGKKAIPVELEEDQFSTRMKKFIYKLANEETSRTATP